jgi:peptidoglycan/LPS O-acetylase OafA/YrhL
LTSEIHWQRQDRIPQLDGIRGIAILLVLIWHYFNRQVHPTDNNFLAYLKLASNITWSGVDLFFVLSGFLIGGILLDNRSTSNYYRIFYLRRICRIFPLYFLIVFSFIALSRIASDSFSWLFADPLPTWTYLTFIQNYPMGTFGFGPHWISVTWSLAVEEQFYLVLPVFIRFLRRTWMVPVLLGLILCGPIMRLWVSSLGDVVYAFCRLDSLLIGVLLACLYRHDKFVRLVRQYRLLCWWSLAFMVAVTGLLPLGAYEMGGVYNHFWLALVYGLLVLSAVCFRESWLGTVLANPAIVWLGVRSYCIYLVHQVMSGLMHGAVFGAPPQMSNIHDVAVTGVALISTLILASFSFHYFEKPFLAFAHKFRYRAA